MSNSHTFRSFCQEHLRNQPDYSAIELAFHWANEICREKRANNQYPDTLEIKEIEDNCLKIIVNAIEQGELKAEPDPNNPQFLNSSIIATADYINWAIENNAGPKILAADNQEAQSSKSKTETETENNPGFKINSKLHDRLIAAVIDFGPWLDDFKRNHAREVRLEKDIRNWLRQRNFTSREFHAFSVIIAEHYNLPCQHNKTKK